MAVLAMSLQTGGCSLKSGIAFEGGWSFEVVVFLP